MGIYIELNDKQKKNTIKFFKQISICIDKITSLLIEIDKNESISFQLFNAFAVHFTKYAQCEKKKLKHRTVSRSNGPISILWKWMRRPV